MGTPYNQIMMISVDGETEDELTNQHRLKVFKLILLASSTSDPPSTNTSNLCLNEAFGRFCLGLKPALTSPDWPLGSVHADGDRYRDRSKWVV